MIGSLLNADSAKPTEKLIILGASGSVGSTAINFLENNPDVELSGFSVHTSIESLSRILNQFSTLHTCITDEKIYDQHIDSLQSDFPGVTFYRGESGSIEMIEESGADTVLTAVVGASGIRATMASLATGKKIALANKETMVTAGPAISEFIKQSKVKPVILPVDSEHNALFQLIHGVPENHIEKLILTASGGPFRDMPIEKISNVSREQVLNHPTWNMGPKITVDSAGMINKGLEVIEAHHLFSIPYEKLDVLIHKKSFIHGMMKTKDGGYLLAASSPDMIFPVAHALRYPDSAKKNHEAASDPDKWPPLEFQKVNPARYPGYSLALSAGKTGGTGPAVFNAANEISVNRFLTGNIEFTDIPKLIEMVMEKITPEYGTEIGLFLEADQRARKITEEQAVLLSR